MWVNVELDRGLLMAVKIVHITRPQEVRFGDQGTAEHYVDQYGGPDAW